MDIFNFLKEKSQPREIARERLKLVLIHDRSNCSPQMLEMIKADIVEVLSHYVEVEGDDMDIQVIQGDAGGNSNVPILFANIPIKSVRKVTRTSP